MKVGMNMFLYTFQVTKQHLPVFERLKEIGYEGVELEVSLIPESDLKDIAAKIRGLELGVSAMSIIPAEADPRSEDKTKRDLAVDFLKRSIDRAQYLGANMLVGPMTQGMGAQFDWIPDEAERNRVAETLARVAEYAASVGFRLAPEVCNRYETCLGSNIADMMDLIKRTGMNNIGLHVDTYHGNIDEADVCEAWKKAGRNIFEVHIAENHRGIPGTGHAVYPEIFSTLKEMAYDGWLYVEAFFYGANLHQYFKRAGSEDEIALRSLEYIRRFI